jgi:hypothetical protein
MLVKRIIAAQPDVVFVGRTAAHFAQQLLRDANITLVVGVKQSIMDRLARSTQAEVRAQQPGRRHVITERAPWRPFRPFRRRTMWTGPANAPWGCADPSVCSSLSKRRVRAALCPFCCAFALSGANLCRRRTRVLGDGT